jgi:trehalose/maltose hydrolase-like predicted phosphorylase
MSKLVQCENGWTLVENGFLPGDNRKYEGLFTQGSGYLHIRGALEEHLAGAPQNQSYTYAGQCDGRSLPQDEGEMGDLCAGDLR